MNTDQPIIWFTNSSSLAELNKGIKTTIGQGCKGLMLLTCIENQYDEQQTNKLLKECSLPIAGGMFPQIIFNENTYAYGAIVLGVMFAPIIANYSKLSTLHSDLKSYINRKSKELTDYQNFIIIADAFCNVNEDFTDEFYDYIGSGITIVGGGVGSLDFKIRPAIYTNQGLIGDAMQVIAIPYPIKKEIGHGWEILDGPYLVTASEGHLIQSLNYIPAFELYREVLKTVTNKSINKKNFFNIAKHFPLGLDISGEELLVRDPITSNGSYIECVGNVPVYSTVYLLKGERDKILLSAATTSQNLAKRTDTQTGLIFDCISRGLYLGKGIKDELKAIQRPLQGATLIGAMSIGEITNTQSGAIRLLNKSTVIASFSSKKHTHKE